MHERLGGTGRVIESVGIGGDSVHMEWARYKSNLLNRSEDSLSEEEDGPIRVEWVRHLCRVPLRKVVPEEIENSLPVP
jgi:hypothetical protein